LGSATKVLRRIELLFVAEKRRLADYLRCVELKQSIDLLKPPRWPEAILGPIDEARNLQSRRAAMQCIANGYRSYHSWEEYMKCHVSRVAVVLLLGCSMPLFAQVSKHASAGSPLDKANLEQVVAAWVTLDASRAAPFYATDDPGLVIYDIAPLKYTGWAEVEKGAVKVFQPIKSMRQKLSDDVKIHNSGNTAWATATLIMYLLNKDGSREKIDARWTTIWEKRGTNWVIVHEHLSTPPTPTPDAALPKRP
jgi:ketosteroid isomerase-like protein